jgi:hypothetical protein
MATNGAAHQSLTVLSFPTRSQQRATRREQYSSGRRSRRDLSSPSDLSVESDARRHAISKINTLRFPLRLLSHLPPQVSSRVLFRAGRLNFQHSLIRLSPSVHHEAMLLLTFLALGFRFIRGTYAAVEVRTIDDQYGDSATGALPVYLPSGEWTYGPTCGTQCYIGQSKYVVFNTSAIFNGSWHDTTFRENQPQKYISLSFTGEHTFRSFNMSWSLKCPPEAPRSACIALCSTPFPPYQPGHTTTSP